MGRTTSVLKPMSVSPDLHKKMKRIATEEETTIGKLADKLFMPVVDRQLRILFPFEYRNGGKR